MFRCIEYTAFLWKAKGRHGTHSPFAYWLADHVNRQKAQHSKNEFTEISSRKTRNFLNRLSNCLPHFQIFNFTQKESPIPKGLGEKEPSILILWAKQIAEIEVCVPFELLHPDTILVILEPHRSSHKEVWQGIVAYPTFHFSADCFDFGLLSPRPGQAKEHFYLKLS